MDAKLLARIRAEKSSLLDIRLNADVVKAEQMQALEKLLRAHAGNCRTTLRLEIPKRSESVLDLGDDYKVAATDDLLARIEQTGTGPDGMPPPPVTLFHSTSTPARGPVPEALPPATAKCAKPAVPATMEQVVDVVAQAGMMLHRSWVV
jgi:hypothetical protein